RSSRTTRSRTTSNPSMRPRHQGRGEPLSFAFAIDYRRYLQCGHGTKAVENVTKTSYNSAGEHTFNAATAPRPWRTSDKILRAFHRVRLQCGHGTKAVE